MSDAFLNAVNPTKALITNENYTVASEISTKLQERNIEYRTTGNDGYVYIETDGTNNWTANEAPAWP